MSSMKGDQLVRKDSSGSFHDRATSKFGGIKTVGGRVVAVFVMGLFALAFLAVRHYLNVSDTMERMFAYGSHLWCGISFQ